MRLTTALFTTMILGQTIMAQFSMIGTQCNTYGYTCLNRINPTPGVLTATGDYHIGKSYRITSTGVVTGCFTGPMYNVIITGIQSCNHTIPRFYTGISDCVLYVVPIHWYPSRYQDFTIPDDPRLRGMSIFHQSYIWFGEQNIIPTYFISSNGIEVKIQ